LLNSGYFPEILGSLAEAGFDARWVVLGADDVGAPHRRKRLWIVADSDTGHGIQSDKTLRAGGLTSDNGSQYAYNAEKPSRPWPPEPELGRVTSDGVAHRVDRLKAIGNGQVPLVVAQAWEILK
jgi:DNA (cytosine-5)-methyltransferase 1